MTGPVAYVHLPTEKQAFRYDGTNAHDIALWADSQAYVTDLGDLVVSTEQGDFRVHVGDYVVFDPTAAADDHLNGYYPCPASIFEAEYRPVTDVVVIGDRIAAPFDRPAGERS